MFEFPIVLGSTHTYSLCASGIRMKDKCFCNRDDAKQEMYNFMSRKGLVIQKIYDDNHFKTYVCDNGVRFYINRM